MENQLVGNRTLSSAGFVLLAAQHGGYVAQLPLTTQELTNLGWGQTGFGQALLTMLAEQGASAAYLAGGFRHLDRNAGHADRRGSGLLDLDDHLPDREMGIGDVIGHVHHGPERDLASDQRNELCLGETRDTLVEFIDERDPVGAPRQE